MRPADLVDFWKSLGANLHAEGSAEWSVAHFGDAEAEARWLHEGAGLADGGHGTLAWLGGNDRVEFLNGQCTADLRDLADGGALPAVLTSAKGRVIDLVTVFPHEQRLGLVTSRGQASNVAAQLASRMVMEHCEIGEPAPGHVHLRLVGTGAADVARRVLSLDLPPVDGAMRSHHGDDLHAVSTRGPAGVALELFVGAARRDSLVAELRAAGVKPVGDQAVDRVRIATGLPVLGREMGDHTNPLESGLSYAVSFQKGCYVGQEVVARLHNYGKVKRRLCKLRFPGAVDPALLNEVFWDLLRVGEVTSAARSATEDATYALALIKTEYAKEGTPVYSVHESERIDGEVRAAED